MKDSFASFRQNRPWKIADGDRHWISDNITNEEGNIKYVPNVEITLHGYTFDFILYGKLGLVLLVNLNSLSSFSCYIIVPWNEHIMMLEGHNRARGALQIIKILRPIPSEGQMQTKV